MRAASKRPTVDLKSFVSPCLARPTTAPPAGDQWAHEIKFDGYRLQARLETGSVQLFTRTGLDWTARFRLVAKALGGLQVTSALIDGEVVVEDERGASSFALLVDQLKAGRSERMVYFAFDLLQLNGEDVTALALSDRKALLQKILERQPKDGAIRYSQHIEGKGAAMFAEVCKLGLEGIISKRLDLPYRSGRHGGWLKSKCFFTDEFVIGGYANLSGSKEAVGALALGFYEGRKFVYAGRVGTGFSQITASQIWQALQPLKTATPHFSDTLDPLQRQGMIWVKPKLVAQIEYRTWTPAGLLRHAAFKALREDKAAKDVKRPEKLTGSP
jgi:bifunctional non-homologous end joining protein LigD